jgi:hypothetical protein
MQLFRCTTHRGGFLGVALVYANCWRREWKFEQGSEDHLLAERLMAAAPERAQ